MATFNLIKTPEVEASVTAPVHTAFTPTISAYNVWYNCGTVVWTSLATDVIVCNGYITTDITSISCTGSDRLGCYVRSRLVDNTTGLEQWASSQTSLIYRRIGSTNYGVLADCNTIVDRLWAGPSGLLVPGHAYTWTIEVMKQQEIGVPTLTYTVVDASIFSDTARLNP